MAKSKPDLEEVPLVCAGIQTIRCNECEFETTVIIPEESYEMLVKILEHIQQHGIAIPQFSIEMH